MLFILNMHIRSHSNNKKSLSELHYKIKTLTIYNNQRSQGI